MRVHFATLMDICHLKNSEWEPKLQKIQRQSRAPRWHCKRWLWSLRSVYWTGLISSTNDGSKSHRYHIQIARVRRTSSWRSIRLAPRSKWKMLPNYWRFRSQNVQILGYVYRNTRSSWAKSVRSPSRRTIMGNAIRESSFSFRMGKSSKLGMLFVNWEKDYSYLCMWTIKLTGKTENIKPTWNIFMEDVDLGEPTSFLDHVYLGCTQRECQTSKDIADN